MRYTILERYNHFLIVLQNSLAFIEIKIYFIINQCIPYLKVLCDELFSSCHDNLIELTSLTQKKIKLATIKKSGNKLAKFLSLLCKYHTYISGKEHGDKPIETIYNSKLSAEDIKKYCQENCPSINAVDYVSCFTHFWLGENIRKIAKLVERNLTRTEFINQYELVYTEHSNKLSESYKLIQKHQNDLIARLKSNCGSIIRSFHYQDKNDILLFTGFNLLNFSEESVTFQSTTNTQNIRLFFLLKELVPALKPPKENISANIIESVTNNHKKKTNKINYSPESDTPENIQDVTPAFRTASKLPAIVTCLSYEEKSSTKDTMENSGGFNDLFFSPTNTDRRNVPSIPSFRAISNYIVNAGDHPFDNIANDSNLSTIENPADDSSPSTVESPADDSSPSTVENSADEVTSPRLIVDNIADDIYSVERTAISVSSDTNNSQSLHSSEILDESLTDAAVQSPANEEAVISSAEGHTLPSNTQEKSQLQAQSLTDPAVQLMANEDSETVESGLRLNDVLESNTITSESKLGNNNEYVINDGNLKFTYFDVINTIKSKDFHVIGTDIFFQDKDNMNISNISSSSNPTFEQVQCKFALDLFQECIYAFKAENRIRKMALDIFTFMIATKRDMKELAIDMLLHRIGHLFAYNYSKAVFESKICADSNNNVLPQLSDCLVEFVIPPLLEQFKKLGLTPQELSAKYSFFEIIFMFSTTSKGQYFINKNVESYIVRRVGKVMEFVGGVLFDTFITAAINSTDFGEMNKTDIRKEVEKKVGSANVISLQKLAVALEYMKSKQSFVVKEKDFSNKSAEERNKAVESQITRTKKGRDAETVVPNLAARERKAPEKYNDNWVGPSKSAAASKKKVTISDKVEYANVLLEHKLFNKYNNQVPKDSYPLTNTLQKLFGLLNECVSEYISKTSVAVVLQPTAFELFIFYANHLNIKFLNLPEQIDEGYAELLTYLNDMIFRICFSKTDIIANKKTKLIGYSGIDIYKSMAWIVFYYDNVYGKPNTTRNIKNSYDSKETYNNMVYIRQTIAEFFDFLNKSEWESFSIFFSDKLKEMIGLIISFSDSDIEDNLSAGCFYKNVFSDNEVSMFYQVIDDFLKYRTKSPFPKILVNDYIYKQNNIEVHKVFHYGNYSMKAWKVMYDILEERESSRNKELCIFISSPVRNRLAPTSQDEVLQDDNQIDHLYSFPIEVSTDKLREQFVHQFNKLWDVLKGCINNFLDPKIMIELSNLLLKDEYDTLKHKIEKGPGFVTIEDLWDEVGDEDPPATKNAKHVTHDSLLTDDSSASANTRHSIETGKYDSRESRTSPIPSYESTTSASVSSRKRFRENNSSQLPNKKPSLTGDNIVSLVQEHYDTFIKLQWKDGFNEYNIKDFGQKRLIDAVTFTNFALIHNMTKNVSEEQKALAMSIETYNRLNKVKEVITNVLNKVVTQPETDNCLSSDPILVTNDDIADIENIIVSNELINLKERSSSDTVIPITICLMRSAVGNIAFIISKHFASGVNDVMDITVYTQSNDDTGSQSQCSVSESVVAVGFDIQERHLMLILTDNLTMQRPSESCVTLNKGDILCPKFNPFEDLYKSLHFTININ